MLAVRAIECSDMQDQRITELQERLGLSWAEIAHVRQGITAALTPAAEQELLQSVNRLWSEYVFSGELPPGFSCSLGMRRILV
ncbi:hypothetical protein DVB73_06840 [Pseudomonas plecoglossicida]|uniref:Uncharacterized protein n=2 Tax=Pseudomonas plecoglossicida TaxID=70775 RepID=A0AAD0R037_PSEDL|nr:hypothetical protein DVB73_06840 [Pseudomonas plecoglossicida]